MTAPLDKPEPVFPYDKDKIISYTKLLNNRFDFRKLYNLLIEEDTTFTANFLSSLSRVNNSYFRYWTHTFNGCRREEESLFNKILNKEYENVNGSYKLIKDEHKPVFIALIKSTLKPIPIDYLGIVESIDKYIELALQKNKPLHYENLPLHHEAVDRSTTKNYHLDFSLSTKNPSEYDISLNYDYYGEDFDFNPYLDHHKILRPANHPELINCYTFFSKKDTKKFIKTLKKLGFKKHPDSLSFNSKHVD